MKTRRGGWEEASAPFLKEREIRVAQYLEMHIEYRGRVLRGIHRRPRDGGSCLRHGGHRFGLVWLYADGRMCEGAGGGRVSAGGGRGEEARLAVEARSELLMGVYAEINRHVPRRHMQTPFVSSAAHTETSPSGSRCTASNCRRTRRRHARRDGLRYSHWQAGHCAQSDTRTQTSAARRRGSAWVTHCATFTVAAHCAE